MIFCGPRISNLVLAILRPAPWCYFLGEPHFYVVNRLEKYLGHASLDSRRMNLKYILGGFFIFSVGVVVF